MILLLFLGFFLILAGYTIQSLESATASSNLARQVYAKQQAFHLLTSIVPYILENLRKEDAALDTLRDPWAFPFTVSTPEGELTITVYDEDRFINLNYTGESRVYREVVERLFELLRISPYYIDRILAWTGSSTGIFESDLPIKRAKFDSKEELVYLGFSAEDLMGREEGNVSYPGLLDLVTVYSSGKINVNTAPKYVLMALDPRIDTTLADRIMERRASRPFRRVDDLVLVEGFTFDILYRIRNIVDVKSTHFRIKASLKLGDVETTLELVYDRGNNRVLYRSIY